MNRKSKLFFISYILIIAILLLSCSQKEQVDRNNDKDKKIINQIKLKEDNNKTIDRKSYGIEELKVAYPDKKIIVWTYNDTIPMYIDPVVNNINKLLSNNNYKFVLFFQKMSESSYERTINKMIKEGNAPDIISAGLGEAGTLQGTYRAVTNGWFEELDTYINSQEGRSLKEAFPEKMWKTFYVNGTLYGVNGMLPFQTDYVYYVNKDLADKYEISLDELSQLEPFELENILEKVMRGENSENLITYAFNQEDSLDHINNYSKVGDIYNNACDAIVTYHLNEELKALNIFDDFNAINNFKMLSNYRKKGYIKDYDTDLIDNFFLLQGGDDLYGALGKDAIDRLKKQYPKCENIEVIEYAPANLTTQFNSISGVCSFSNNKKEAFQALNVVFSNKEISDLLLYGIEDVNYISENSHVRPKNDNLFNSFIPLHFGNPIIASPTLEEPSNKKEVIINKVNELIAPKSLGIYLELQDHVPLMRKLNSIIDGYNDLYYGKFDDVEKTLKELNDKLEEAGIKYLINEINRQFELLQ